MSVNGSCNYNGDVTHLNCKIILPAVFNHTDSVSGEAGGVTGFPRAP